MSPMRIAIIILIVAALLGVYAFAVSSVIIGSSYSSCHTTTVTTTIWLLTGQTNSTVLPTMVPITNSTTSALISGI